MTVQPISDEELAELEGYSQHTAYLGDEDAAITMGELRGLIARLRAAEVDAKRWRHARDILTVEENAGTTRYRPTMTATASMLLSKSASY
ncbi:TPA: hypothetical protein N2B51_006453 [Pseudomonas aeruginosa]|nr:hypothetical protein [Pseudomonas aeruginosa]